MRVLVTGGAGYVGSHAVLELKRAGHEPVIFDSLMRGHRWVVEKLGVPFIEGDLCNEADITKALKSEAFDAVMHFAAVALVGESVRDPGFYYSVNVSGGLKLLNAMRSAGCKRLIFSSTCAVYGLPEELPIREESQLNPVNPYGHSKLAFEHMMRSFAEAYGFKTLALRYFNAAGADPEGNFGEIHHPETHLIPNLF
ncbi:MAG: NAD-dependent epimerase/dehydratase family protein, partial [Planctomycetota bacterium]|nr:NAD-dependent epimerase/dehydratase family protein [Planctomycetota bacterium]